MKTKLFFLLFFTFSCKNEIKETKNFKIIHISNSLKKAIPKHLFKNYFSIKKIIVLETNEESMISSVSKILYIKDNIYILDLKYSGVKVFNKEGKYLFSIGKLGQGPGEFSKIFDMNYDKKNSCIHIFSNDDMKMAKFKLNGDFVSESKVPFFSAYFSLIEDKYLFYSNYNTSELNDRNNLILSDLKFNVVDKFFPYRRDFGLLMSGFLTKTSNSVLYGDAFSENVYEFKNNNLNLKYKFDFGKYLVPIEVGNNLQLLYKSLLDFSYLSKVDVENKDFLFFSFVHIKMSPIGFFEKKSNKVFTSFDFAKNDIFNILSPFSPLEDNENLFLSYITSEKFNYYNSNNPTFNKNLKYQYNKLFNSVSKLKDIDNPIIIIFNKI